MKTVTMKSYAQYTPPPPTRRDKTVSSRRRRRCVLGFKQWNYEMTEENSQERVFDARGEHVKKIQRNERLKLVITLLRALIMASFLEQRNFTSSM